MKNLKDCTFMIPVRIEHQDRYNNAKSVLGFLNHHFETNVSIYEVSESGESKLDFLSGLKNLKIDHIIETLPIRKAFHRTKYLNTMLDKVKTPCPPVPAIITFSIPSSLISCFELRLPHSDKFRYTLHTSHNDLDQWPILDQDLILDL